MIAKFKCMLCGEGGHDGGGDDGDGDGDGVCGGGGICGGGGRQEKNHHSH